MAKRGVDYVQEATRRRYPWDQWLNGDTWELTRDRHKPGKPRELLLGTGDYSMTPKTFQKFLFLVAARHGLKVQTSISGSKIRFQFYGTKKKLKPVTLKVSQAGVNLGNRFTEFKLGSNGSK